MRRTFVLSFAVAWASFTNASNTHAAPEIPAAYAPFTGGRVQAPPPLEEPAPAPYPRAPERPRRPVEVVPELTLSLPTCEEGTGAERCALLGPAFGGRVAALYRPSPYFAWGGAASYARSTGSAGARGEVLGAVLLGRAYLLEQGGLDPYLELGMGYASLRTTTVTNGQRREDVAFGASAQAGGGVDLVLSERLRVGAGAAFAMLVLARGERCFREQCRTGPARGGAMDGGLVTSLRFTWLAGDPL